MRMRSCTENKMSALIQLLGRQGQRRCHPAAKLANLYVTAQQPQTCFLAGQT